ncbi:MAG: lipopolysaccharide biosynthesis protein [Pseudomonadota bacterium]
MSQRNGVGRILTNGAFLSGVVWAEAVVGGLYMIAITRFMGPAEYGLWSYFIATYVVAIAVISVGFESIVHFAYGEVDADGDEIFEAALFWRIALSALGCAAYIATAIVLLSPDNWSTLAMLLIAPAIAGRSIANLVRASFVAREDVKRIFPISVAFRFGELLTGVMLILLGATLIELIVLHVVSWCLEATASLFRLSNDRAFRIRRPKLDRSVELARNGGPRAGLNLTLALMISAPLVLYKPLANDLSDLGFFALAFQIVALVFWSAQAFINASAPELARQATAVGGNELRYSLHVAVAAIAIFGALSIGLMTVGSPAFAFVFGEGYSEVAFLTAAACLAGALQLVPSGFQQALLARRRHWQGLVANLAGCITLVVGFSIAQPDLDPMGGVWIVCAGWAVRLLTFLAVAVTTRALFLARSGNR